MGLADAVPPAVPRRGVRLAWAGAITAMAVLLAGGIVVALAMGESRPPHAVLDARFSTSAVLPSGREEHRSFELWTDPTLSSARLSLLRERDTLFYVRDASGVWYAVGRTHAGAPWRRTRLLAGQAPSLLTEQGVRALFARLRRRARAGTVTAVALGHHMTIAFPTMEVTWPYRYGGETTVWVDTATGLPLQYRNALSKGGATVVFITVVDSLRTISSTTLPEGFFTPPDRRSTPWDAVVQRVVGWIDERLGRCAYGTMRQPSGSS